MAERLRVVGATRVTGHPIVSWSVGPCAPIVIAITLAGLFVVPQLFCYKGENLVKRSPNFACETARAVHVTVFFPHIHINEFHAGHF